MNEREVKKGITNYDALDTDGGDVAAMLNALPRVGAPEDFEFRVKARIARGSAARSTLFPFLKLAAPLTLVLLIGAFVVFYGLLPEQTEVPVVIDAAQKEPAIVPPKSELPAPPAQPVSSPQIEQPDNATPKTPYVAESKPTGVRRTLTPEAVKPSQGGSRDFSLNSAQPKLPPGFQSVGSQNLNANTNSSAANTPVRNVLEILGIAADFSDEGWKVRSVVENGVASRAGIRAGDVIEAIDGQTIKGDTLRRGSAKTFTVRRDGKQISLNLTN